MSNTPSDFHEFLEQRIEASDAFVNGDFGLLEKVSTHTSPATIFGPQGNTVEGAERVNAVNAEGAKLFKPGSKNAFETLHTAVADTLAYWVGVQRSVVQMKGKDEGIPMNLRLTEIFRLEDDGWKLIHRHADMLKED